MMLAHAPLRLIQTSDLAVQDLHRTNNSAEKRACVGAHRVDLELIQHQTTDMNGNKLSGKST